MSVYVPTSLQNTRGTVKDMVRVAPIFCGPNESLHIRWQWNGNVHVAEYSQGTLARPEDAFAFLPEGVVSIGIVNVDEETYRSVEEEIAAAWLDKYGMDGMPPFVRDSAALVDYRDECAEPSVAEENRMTKTQIGVA